MEDNWSETTLADVSFDVAYGYTESASLERVGPHFLRITDIQNGVVDWSGVPFCPISPEEHCKYRLQSGDIVVARTGNSTGENYLFRGNEDAVFASYLIRFRIDDSKADPAFVWYHLRSAAWWGFINGAKTGSAQAGANAKVLGTFPLTLPPLPEQKRIAHILGTLDDKIELNRRMNATLEAMSRAMFKSWFVDFDPVRQKAAGKQPVGMDAETAALFPDSFEDSEIGEVPKGWGVAEVGEFLSLCRESVDPAEHPTETFDHYSIPAFDSGCWPTLDVGADIKSQKLLVAPGSVLISKLNPRTPRVWIPQAGHARRPVASTEFLVAVPNETTGVGAPFVFCFASSESVVEYLASRASGTSNSHQRVRPDDFLSLRTTLAPNSVLVAFDKVVGRLLQRSNRARLESRTLATLRDTLLPKLLSGELRVPEAAAIVEEASGS